MFLILDYKYFYIILTVWNEPCELGEGDFP